MLTLAEMAKSNSSGIKIVIGSVLRGGQGEEASSRRNCEEAVGQGDTTTEVIFGGGCF